MWNNFKISRTYHDASINLAVEFYISNYYFIYLGIEHEIRRNIDAFMYKLQRFSLEISSLENSLVLWRVVSILWLLLNIACPYNKKCRSFAILQVIFFQCFSQKSNWLPHKMGQLYDVWTTRYISGPESLLVSRGLLIFLTALRVRVGVVLSCLRHGREIHAFHSLQEPLVGKPAGPRPGEYREEGKQNGGVGVPCAGRFWHIFLSGVAPLVGEVAETNEVEDCPQTGEPHVTHDEVFAALGGRHLLEKVLARHEARRPQEPEEANGGAVHAGAGVLVEHADLLLGVLGVLVPAARGDAPVDDHAEQKAQNFDDDLRFPHKGCRIERGPCFPSAICCRRHCPHQHSNQNQKTTTKKQSHLQDYEKTSLKCRFNLTF